MPVQNLNWLPTRLGKRYQVNSLFRHGVYLLSLGAAVSISPSAHAVDVAVAGTSFISGLTFQVIDLDPNDGIAASYRFDTQGGAPAGYTDALVTTGVGSGSVQNAPFNSTSNFLAPGIATSAQAGVVGSAQVGKGGLASEGAVTNYGAAVSSTVRTATQDVSTGFPFTLWLAPNTALIASAYATTTASVNGGCSVYPSGLCGSVHTEAIMTGRVVSGGVITQVLQSGISSDAGVGTFLTFGFDGLPVFDTGLDAVTYGKKDKSSGLLSITFTNNSLFETSQYLQLDTVVAAQAVPEPATYALMLAGLLGLGLTARRRRS